MGLAGVLFALSLGGSVSWAPAALGATLEDLYGDCANSACDADACPIEQRILDRGTGSYAYPSSAVSSGVLLAVDRLLSADVAGAAAAAAGAGYQVTVFVDDVRQRTYHMLEPAGANSGHGTFIFNLGGDRSLLVEAPHVGFDTRTVDFGLEVFGRLDAGVLLIPGADRYANYTCNGCSTPCTLMPGLDDSDVTRTELSLFHLVHQALLDHGTATCRRTTVIQPHGFGTTTQQRPGCDHHFILSDGDGSRTVDPPHLTRLGAALETHTVDGTGNPADAYTWNVASNAGNDCGNLLATLNRQGRATRTAGGLFIHMEMQALIRAWPDASDAAEVASAAVESRYGHHLLGAGLGPANPNQVRLADRDGQPTTVDFLAYSAGGWGANVAAGDLDGGTWSEILTGPGPGSVFGPQVRGFVADGQPLARINFYAYGTLRFGVNVGLGELDGDAFDELLSGAGPGEVFGPHVRGWNFDGGSITALARLNFFSYQTLRFGVNLSGGSLDPDCYAEIATGPGPGVVFGPQVRAFDYDGGTLAAIGKVNFLSFGTGRYGVNLAVGDVDGDGMAEIAAARGPGPSLPAEIAGFDYDGQTVAALPGFPITPFGTGYGARVGIGPLDDDGGWELVTGAGRDPAADSTVRSYLYEGAAPVLRPVSFLAFPGTSHGVNVAASTFGDVR